MRKHPIAAIAVLTALTLTGCSGQATSSSNAASTTSSSIAPGEPATAPEPKPADLTGEWGQEGASESSMSATITADTISIDWVNSKENTTAVYWVGTYQAPSEPGDFTWTSTRNEEATNSALLASTDPTKEFSFAGDKVSYKVTMMGVTKTISLVRK